MDSGKKHHTMKAVFSRKIASSYESELKTTLLLILLFLILISVSSLRVSGKMAGIFREENYNQLVDGADKLIAYVERDVDLLRTTSSYREILENTPIVRAEYEKLVVLNGSDQNGGAPYLGDDIVHAYYSNLSHDDKEKLVQKQIVRLGFGSGKDNDRIAILYHFKDAHNVDWIGIFQKNASGLKLVNTVIKYNYLLQIAGLLGVLLVAYAYLKITLNPFKKLATEARKVQVENDKHGESVEQIVETFKATIARLRENEDKLKELYNNSQQRAQRLEQFNQYILESMSSGLIGIDIKGRIVHLNRSARRILGLQEDSVDYDSYEKTLNDYAFLAEVLNAVIATNQPVERMEHSFTRHDGTEKALGLAASPVHDHKRRLVGALLLLADLTEVRRLQQEIAFKEKMAAVGEMSAGLAHEMRNAMMAIVGFSKLLQKSDLDVEQVHDIAASIGSESENCEIMLKRFLTFAKPAALTPENLSLAEIGNCVVQKLEQTARNKGAEIRVQIEPNLPDFRGDRTALDQILTNLLKNAVEAAPENGSAELKISHDSRLNRFKIEIADNGPGIPQEHSLKVFSPFFTTKEQGTGLGLAIVKKLVSSMGGSVEIDPEKADGCRIIVTLAGNCVFLKDKSDLRVPQAVT
jgi:PAS domain S-box-containing protein